MKKWAQFTSYKNEAEKIAAGTLYKLIVTTGAVCLFVAIVGSYYSDVNVIAIVSVSLVILIVPYVLLRCGQINAASMIFTLLVIGVLTVSAILGQGINDITIIAFPIIYFFASVSLNHTVFRICLAITLLVVFGLTFGELNGWFTPKPFLQTDWFDFMIVGIVLITIAFAADLVVGGLKKNLESAGLEIIDRKKTEKALKKSEEKYRRIFDNLQDGYFLANSDGNILLANTVAADILGYDLKELMQKNMAQDIYFSYEDRETVKEMMAQTGKIENYEIIFQRKDGQKIIVEANSHLVYGDNQVVSMEGTFRDITARKHDELEKLLAQKTADEHKKQALVGQIAGKMAHDFNNILQVVMGSAQLAIVNCKEAKTIKILELIVNQTMRGKNLTGNLVAFAKDQQPKQEFFKINKKINLVLDLMTKDLEGIELIKENKSELPELLADPGMIEHAIVNLIQNSIHALSMVESPKIIFRTYNYDNYISFEIEDNGCGISKENMELIYEPSFTLKGSKDVAGSYKSGIKGTGYGMCNVKKYIEQHKGTISIESELGSGTKITIDLPVIKKELTPKEKIELREGIKHFEKNILLVEDETAISEVQYRILISEPCNHKVDVAPNGQEAKDLFERNTYDFVSLDYVLPGGINGMDLYHHIRKTNQTVPVLFISGNIEFLESIKDLKQNDLYIDHLSKPCQNKEYVNSINNLLDKTFSL